MPGRYHLLILLSEYLSAVSRVDLASSSRHLRCRLTASSLSWKPTLSNLPVDSGFMAAFWAFISSAKAPAVSTYPSCWRNCKTKAWMRSVSVAPGLSGDVSVASMSAQILSCDSYLGVSIYLLHDCPRHVPSSWCRYRTQRVPGQSSP